MLARSKKVPHFLKDDDIDPYVQLGIIKVARLIKSSPQEFKDTLRGEAIGLYFEKPSLRTRVSAERAAVLLGAHPVILRGEEVHFHRGETPEDAARVLSGYLTLLLGRVFHHELLESLSAPNAISIVNGLSDKFHPLQALADLLTIYEAFNERLDDLKICYLGEGNNVAASLSVSLSRIGLKVTISSPTKYALKDLKFSSNLSFEEDPKIAVKGAHVVYTDTWTSMGSAESESSNERKERIKTLSPYQVNAELLKEAHSDHIILHCLPAHFGEEITREIFEGRSSRIILQAHNRLPTVAAVFLLLRRRELFYKLMA